MEKFFHAYDRVLAKWPVPVESVDLESQWGTTHVNICGPTDGVPIVLLPGGGATSTVWFANVAALSRQHRVFAVDPIGQPGRSTVGSTPIENVGNLMLWLGGVLDGLMLGAVDVVGHSYGAMISLAFALDAPDRVNALTLLDPNSCFAGMSPRYLAHAVPLLVRPTYQRQRSLIEWETGGAAIDPDWLDLQARGAADFRSAKTVVPRRPTAQALSRMPSTTVFLAEKSKVHNASRIAETIRSTLPHIETVMVPDCTHHMMPMHVTFE
ncbi:alpha/beta fold hydrolase [Actinomycetes bacterium M1A6_2h]